MPSGHPQHRGCDSFDCCTERYEIVVLLPNSELTIVMISAVQMRTVRLGRKTMAGAALLTPNNFVVCGQKYKVLVLVFLVERNTLKPKFNILGEIFCFATYSVESAVAQW